MAEFLVAPPEPVRWAMDAEAFAAAVIARWPEAGVRGWGPDAHLIASAWVRTPNPWDDILIELHPNGQTIGIDVRSYQEAAEIACWWRSQAPPDISVLWLFDRSYGGHSEIWPDTAPAQLFSESPA